MDKKLIGFCTDCCEWREVDDESGRGNCGHGRVACPPEGYRIIGPEEEARIRAEERERCAAWHERKADAYKKDACEGDHIERARRLDLAEFHDNAAITLRQPDTEYVCVRREELEALAEMDAELFHRQNGNLHSIRFTCDDSETFYAVEAFINRLRTLLKQKEGE